MPTFLIKALNFYYITMWRIFRRADFYRDLSDAYLRRVNLRDFLKDNLTASVKLKDQTSGIVMRQLIRRIDAGTGNSLESLLARAAPKSDAIFLSTVDESNDKPTALMSLANTLDFQSRILKTLMLELLTPAIALPLALVVSLQTAGIISAIEKNASPTIFNGFNGWVRDMSHFINDYTLAIVLITLGAIAAFVFFIPRKTGKLRLMADDWPLIGLYRDYYAANMLSALALLMANGKTLKESLESIAARASPWLKWQIARVLQSLQLNPNDYPAAFARGMFPKFIQIRLATLTQSTAGFDGALVELGTKETAKLEKKIKVSSAALGAALTGVALAFAVVLSLGVMTIVGDLQKESANAYAPK